MYEIHRKIHKHQFQNKTNKLLEKAKNKVDKKRINEKYNINETFLEVDEEQAVKETLEEKIETEKNISDAQKDNNVTEVLYTKEGNGKDVRNPFDDMSEKLVTDTQKEDNNMTHEFSDNVDEREEKNETIFTDAQKDKNVTEVHETNGGNGDDVKKEENGKLITEAQKDNDGDGDGIKNPFDDMFEKLVADTQKEHNEMTNQFGKKVDEKEQTNEKLFTDARKDKNITEAHDTNGGNGDDVKNPFDDMSGKLITDTQVKDTNGTYVNEEKGDGVLNDDNTTNEFGQKKNEQDEKNYKIVMDEQKHKNVTEVHDTNGGNGDDVNNPFENMSGKLVTDTQVKDTNSTYVNEEKGEGVLDDEYVINTLEDKNDAHESNRNGERGHGVNKPFNNMLGDVVTDKNATHKNLGKADGVKNPFINMFEDTQEDKNGTNAFNLNEGNGHGVETPFDVMSGKLVTDTKEDKNYTEVHNNDSNMTGKMRETLKNPFDDMSGNERNESFHELDIAGGMAMSDTDKLHSKENRNETFHALCITEKMKNVSKNARIIRKDSNEETLHMIQTLDECNKKGGVMKEIPADKIDTIDFSESVKDQENISNPFEDFDKIDKLKVTEESLIESGSVNDIRSPFDDESTIEDDTKLRDIIDKKHEGKLMDSKGSINNNITQIIKEKNITKIIPDKHNEDQEQIVTIIEQNKTKILPIDNGGEKKPDSNNNDQEQVVTIGKQNNSKIVPNYNDTGVSDQSFIKEEINNTKTTPEDINTAHDHDHANINKENDTDISDEKIVTEMEKKIIVKHNDSEIILKVKGDKLKNIIKTIKKSLSNDTQMMEKFMKWSVDKKKPMKIVIILPNENITGNIDNTNEENVIEETIRETEGHEHHEHITHENAEVIEVTHETITEIITIVEDITTENYNPTKLEYWFDDKTTIKLIIEEHHDDTSGKLVTNTHLLVKAQRKDIEFTMELHGDEFKNIISAFKIATDKYYDDRFIRVINLIDGKKPLPDKKNIKRIQITLEDKNKEIVMETPEWSNIITTIHKTIVDHYKTMVNALKRSQEENIPIKVLITKNDNEDNEENLILFLQLFILFSLVLILKCQLI